MQYHAYGWPAPASRQGPAHHQLVHPAQHDRQGGHGHLHQGRHRLGRERDEEDHRGVERHGDRQLRASRPRSACPGAAPGERVARPRDVPGPGLRHAGAALLMSPAGRLSLRAWRSTSRCPTPSSAGPATSSASATSSISGRATPSGRPSRTPSSSPARRRLQGRAGHLLALLLNEQLWFKRLIRGAVLLPWVIPTALSTLGWWWMFNSLYSVVNWTGITLGHLGSARPQLARPEVLRDGGGDDRQRLARAALLRHHDPGRPGGHPQGALRGRRVRRRRPGRALLVRDAADAEARCWRSSSCSRPSSPSATSTSCTC